MGLGAYATAEAWLGRSPPGSEDPLRDLPETPRPPADAPAPVRFVPEYDNLVLSHADRRRIIADEHRKEVVLSAARSGDVPGGRLCDRYVEGREDEGGDAHSRPFGPLAETERDALAEEGERLARFLTGPQDAAAYEVRFADEV